MSGPWAKIEKSEPIKLEEVISEEIARNLQAKEEQKYAMELDDRMSSPEVNDTPSETITDNDSGSEFDKEFDDYLECKEEKCSSYINNCHRLSLNNDFESDSEKEEVDGIQDENDWDTFDLSCDSRSVLKRNKKIDTQEYATVKGGRSTCKLSSKVFNRLEMPSYTEEFKKYKVHRDKKKRPITKFLSIDEDAWRLIREMIKNQELNKVIGILSFDKDAVTLRAVHSWPSWTKYTSKICAIQCAIKVFKINLKLSKGREIACQKAEKEMVNYKILKAAGVPCLNVIAQKEHVLITSYSGTILKDSNFTVYYYRYIFEKVKQLMKRFYEANMIHADLSEHNILWTMYDVYFINISQAVIPCHKNSFNFLFRDCTNVINFFERKGVTNKEKPDQLFKYITGYSFLDQLSLSKLQQLMITKKAKNRNEGFQGTRLR